MKRSFLFLPVLCSVLALGTLAHAQPDPDAAPKGVNPPVQEPGGAAWQRMTGAQRRDAMQTMTEQTLRGAMAFLGLEPTVQSVIVASVKEREKTLADVREKHRIVALGLMGKKDDAEMQIALDNLRFAQDDAAETRTKQIEELDKKIDFSHKPRLKAFLSLAGIISDDSAAVGGVLGNLMNAFTNLGMGDTPIALPPLQPPAAEPAAPVAPAVAEPPVAAG
ncbi:hypothetical protein EON83_09050 [bacterium]|nr:MAG: hypothetical protein EON83_09050 [bacterium]